jgi:AraC-like DNA-binding protein
MDARLAMDDREYDTSFRIGHSDTGSPRLVKVARSAVSEADGYERSVAGVDIDAIRSGVGTGANRVEVVSDGVVTATSCDLGFPIMTRTTIGAERYIISLICSSAGSRWCGLDLQNGSVLVHGPGAEHTGANNAGLGFTFTVASGEALDERAHTLGARIALPETGKVREMDGRRGLDGWRSLVFGLGDAARSRHAGLTMDEVLSAMVLAFRDPNEQTPVMRGPDRLDDRTIAHRCLDLAEALGRRPTLSELCVASRVSERRLRQAFVSQFDVPPAAFFRLWALAQARKRLRTADASVASVTRVGLDLGFGHLSRFAQYYRQVYGESPSATIRMNRKLVWPVLDKAAAQD